MYRTIWRREMNKEEISQLIKSHLVEGEEECRWCFAIDLQRVRSKIIGQYHFPDATVLQLMCPKCGGEFSYYIRSWSEPYLTERITTLHPGLKGQVTDDLIREVNDRMWPEFRDY
jgi:hypothetical protein